MKRLLVTSTGIVGMMLLLIGAAAWACTPQESISLSPSSGPAGTSVTVTGNGFQADDPENPDDAVLVIWHGKSGPEEVASAHGPNFSVTFKVKDDISPDVYYVTADNARASFTVTKPRPQPTGDVPGPSGGDSTTTANGSSGSSGGSTSGSASGSSNSGGGIASVQASGASGGQRSGDTGSGGIPSPDGTEARPTTAPAPIPSGAASGGPDAAVASAGVANRSSSVETRQPTVGGADASPGVAAVEESPVLPAQTAFGDLWSGFAAGPEVRRGASLTQSSGARSGTPADGLGLVLVGMGVASFVFGSLGLVAAERRRRVARVQAS